MSAIDETIFMQLVAKGNSFASFYALRLLRKEGRSREERCE
jgi:hypothetical protein